MKLPACLCQGITVLSVMVGLLIFSSVRAGAADQETFGRLFNTPTQRQALDEQRRRGGRAVAVIPSAAPENPGRLRQPVRLSGVLIRGDGERVLWVNGEQLAAKGKKRPVILGNLQQSANVRVTLPQASGLLKPGQVWLPGKPAQEGYNSAVGRPVMPPAMPEALPLPVAPEPAVEAKPLKPDVAKP